MTYQPKFQQCPYRTSDGRCTHKDTAPIRTKRRRSCGYSDVNDCEMCNEWLELKRLIL